jgi:hypothetical protein
MPNAILQNKEEKTRQNHRKYFFTKNVEKKIIQ